MSKYCGKCGSPLDENGKCPNCNVVTEQFKKKKRKKLLLAVFAVVLLGIAVAGVLFANHEGIIDISFFKNNKSEQQSVSSEEESHIAEDGFSPETAYSAVLKTYKDAFANDYYSDSEDDWDEKNEYDISKVCPEIRSSFGGIEWPLSYCYYDISNDGVPELIISVDYGDEFSHRIVDMLGYENGEVKRLFSLWTFGVRASYSINTNGFICFYGSGGAMYSGETYYQLEKNSASPEIKADLYIEYTDNGTKYYSGPEDNQHEITESEYKATVSQFGEEITLKWAKLCESKLYEAEFSVRGENGINSGYQQLYVTNETKDEMTVVYCQVGESGYPVYVHRGTVFKVQKNGETSNIKWTDGSGNEFTGTVSYRNDCFTLTYKTDSPDSAIKECTGADLYLKDSGSTETSSPASTPSTTGSTIVSSAEDLAPYSIWETFVTNEWIDEEGSELKFTQNITYYKLKPNSTHTDSDYYMGTLSTTNSNGYYYGHYHIDDDNKLRIEFIDWPNGDFGLLKNDSYVWDPTLKTKNSWCMSSDGKIMFSQGDNEFSGKTYHH